MEYTAPYAVAPVVTYQPGMVFHNNMWKTPNQIVAETNTLLLPTPVPLTQQFPVSTGLEHMQEPEEGGGVFGGHQVGWKWVWSLLWMVIAECLQQFVLSFLIWKLVSIVPVLHCLASIVCRHGVVEQ